MRHIERNSILLFLIPADSEDHFQEFKILENELKEYNPELLDKDFLISVSKSDLLDEELKQKLQQNFLRIVSHYFSPELQEKDLLS